MAVAAGVRARPGFDFVPGVVGAAAGLTSGVLKAYGGSLPAWRMGAYKGTLVGLGVLGHFLDWNDDLTYGLQVSGLFGLMEQVGPAISGKSAGILFSDVAHAQRIGAPRRAQVDHVPVNPAGVAGCSACAAAAGVATDALRKPAAEPFRAGLRFPGALEEAPGVL